jgi:hypothetical protein
MNTIRKLVLVCGALLLGTSCGEHRAITAGGPDDANTQRTSPSLVECPTNSTVSTQSLVGILGGTVTLGGTKISIPAGALTLPTLITVTVPASQYMEIDVRANDLTSFLFQEVVTVTIGYSRCTRSDIHQALLSVWHIDPQSHSLLENMGGSDDKNARSITFTTGHLSGYAVAF